MQVKFMVIMHTRVEISRSALFQNVEVFRRLAPSSKFMAIIKSNAYGHGLIECGKILQESVDWFGVNSLDEALRLRHCGIETPILVMGATDFASLKGEIPGGLTFVLSSISSIKELESRYPGTPFHLKVDTGMSRLGYHGEDLEEVLDYLENLPDLKWSGLMTHFANVEDVTNQEYALSQLRMFHKWKSLALKAAGNRILTFHTAASAAAMLMPESQMDMIRIGISLYGLWPSTATRVSLLGLNREIPELQPVMRWVTKIVHLTHVDAGISVGYGCTYKTQVPTKIAVLPVGYFEGYTRALSNRSHVIIGGSRARLIGRVCMNMIMVDVTHIPEAAVGDDAVLIGSDGHEEVTADELADLVSTINYEIVTGVQQDLERVITD